MMEQMRRSMWEGWDGRPSLGTGGHSDINLSLETGEEGYVVLADMPGFEREEIDLRFEDGTLSIEAAHETNEDDGATTRRHSRRVHEQLSVPGDVIEEEIGASYRNGVLEIHLPIREEIDEEDDGTRIDID